MTHKSLPMLIVVLLLSLALSPAFAFSNYAPHAGDYFSYREVENLGSGTGSYAGYSEQTIINGKETMNSINANGIVSASYSYTYSFSNSSGSTESGSQSGEYTFSSTTYLYVNGTDDQTGYANPSVWFYMPNSTPKSGTFSLLNTLMTVTSTSYSYYLPSESQNVDAIYAQGSGSYERNDVYGQFTATYTWKAYFDSSTGYIIGYEYVEQDTNPSGNGFTYTDSLYVTQTSYSLTAAQPTNTGVSPISDGGVAPILLVVAFIIAIIIVIAIIAYAISRRNRKLPKHSPVKGYVAPPPTSPPSVDLTPKEQPPVQQIVIKEVVKVNCRYCGALIDSTAQTCPICGAPRN